MCVDEATKNKFTGFLKHKSDMGSYIFKLVKKIRNMNYSVNSIRCDRAGENQNLEKQFILHDLKNIKVERTAAYSPQQNGIAERSIAYLYYKIIAILNQAGYKLGMRRLLWAEATNYVIMTDNILVKYKSNHPTTCFSRQMNFQDMQMT